MVEHFSYLTYVHLVKSTSQEETLSGKLAFARWSATFGAKINRYNSYNGRFAEHNFISAIEDSNKAITFCGVGSHHQNSTVERKIQNLTIWDRTLLLHKNRYCAEAITTMLWPYSLKAFAEQFNVIKVDYDGITPMEKFSGTTTYINLKNHHTWVYPVYVLDAILQGNIAGITKW